MSEVQSPEDRIGQQIKSDHPWQFRRGQWGTVVDVVPFNGRNCFLVIWLDNVTDLWVVDDPLAGYRFREMG